MPALQDVGGAAYLLDTGNMSRDVFNRNGILHGEAVTLTFYAGFIYQDATICR